MYDIESTIGVMRYYFTLREDMAMKVWVLGTLYGTIIGVYSTKRKAQHAREAWERAYSGRLVMSECEVNEDVT